MKKALVFIFALCMVAVLFLPSATAAEIVSSGTCGENVTWTLDDAGTLTISGTGAMEDYAYTISAPWASQRSSIIKVVIESGVSGIGGYAFFKCTNMTDIMIPDSVTTIGDSAIRECSKLTSITLPNSITHLSNGILADCTSLTSIAIPDSVTTIGEFVFQGCCSLTEVYIPDGITALGARMFAGCDSLAKITLPDCVTMIGAYAFSGCSGLTEIILPDGVTSIEAGAFSDCIMLTGINIPDGVTTIGHTAFKGCIRLTGITIPDSVTTIGSNAFKGCTGLTEITIPNGVTVISTDLFEDCTSLTNITLPEGITSIGGGAFYNCENLESITLPEGITQIGRDAFHGCKKLKSITIPDSVTSIGEGALSCCESLESVTIPFVGSRRKTAANTYQYPFGYIFGNWSFDGSIEIEQRYYGKYTSIFTSSVYHIPGGLRSVTVTGGEILRGAFEQCVNLTSITLPDTATTLGESAFSECFDLTSITVPDGVTHIGENAFQFCFALTSITIPESVTSIGNNAFDDYYGLDVYFAGTEGQWNAIAVDYNYNPALKKATMHYAKTVTLPTLTGTGFTLSFEDEILANFYYTAENTEDVTEQGMLVFYADPGTADISKADDVYAGSATDGSVFMNTTHGIAAKYMGDNRYYCAYAKLTDGTYAYSPLYQYSPKKYALGRIANSSNDKLKALCVSMLNYGAAAQNFFGYRTDDLMNTSLTAEQKALVVSYDAGLFTGAVAADSAKIGGFSKTVTGFTKKNASVSFEGAFAINYYFTPEFAVDGDVTLYIWDRETYEAVETLTADNASSAVMTGQDGTWFASVSGIAPKDLDKTYYVAGVYTDESGNTYCTGVIAYSLSRYCMNNANGTMGELAQATAMYGYYAKNYFA